MNKIWFASEFHGSKAPIFSKSTDVTYWEGVKFFHKKEDAIAHAFNLANENMSRLIRDNIEYENVFYGEGLDVFNWNRLVDLHKLPCPYLILDKYEVDGKVNDKMFICLASWEEKGSFMPVHNTNVLCCVNNEEKAKHFISSFPDKEKYFVEYAIDSYSNEKMFYDFVDVLNVCLNH